MTDHNTATAEPTKVQKALNIIEKRPGIRSPELCLAADIEAKKTAKPPKSTAKKSAPTPSKAPPGEETDRADGRFEKGDRVKVKADARGPNGLKRKCAGREGVISNWIARGATPEGDVYTVAFEGKDPVSGLTGAELERLPTPPEAAQPVSVETPAGETAAAKQHPLVEFRHPENPDLCWTGRGRKPKWVEVWLTKAGNTLDQLRINDGQKKPSSAPRGANATPCAAEHTERCTRTIELPFA